MKRMMMLCVATLAFFGMPSKGAACSRCDTEEPKCLEAINIRCYAYPKTRTCDEYTTSCAYAYAPTGISADGSIADPAASPVPGSATEQVRGCHGLIVDRAYSDDRQAQARAGSEHIVL